MAVEPFREDKGPNAHDHILEGMQVRVSGYKCFGDDPAGFDELRPINVLVGRNNSGKSSLLDLLAFVVDGDEEFLKRGHRNLIPQVFITSRFTENALRTAFPANSSEGLIRGNHWAFGRRWIDKSVTWKVEPQGKRTLVNVDPNFDDPRLGGKFEAAMQTLDPPLKGRTFRRLSADRDVVPEDDSNSLAIDVNGGGFTTAVASFLLQAGLPSDLIERDLLHSLNEVYAPASSFEDIDVQRLDDGRWEIYLGEETKGRIPLSRSGSGLKTILLLLACLHLVPAMEDKPLSQYVFGFEELENNLHPALQRRVCAHLREVCRSSGSVVVMTTHSNVVIDQFANDPLAQVIHVTHNGTCASAARVSAYTERRGILDDLDVRASDLLQANGIIWVEGPSDRLYVRRWIKLASENTLREGTHYQIVFYGGRLLAHLSSAIEESEDLGRYLQILRVNRNAILVMDSDRSRKGAPLNQTKRRMREEMKALDGMTIVTAGKEIENYLPEEALRSLLEKGRPLTPLKQYETFPAYLGRIDKIEASRFNKNKALFAERVIPHLTLEGLKEQLDLGDVLPKLVEKISSWNGISEQR